MTEQKYDLTYQERVLLAAYQLAKQTQDGYEIFIGGYKGENIMTIRRKIRVTTHKKGRPLSSPHVVVSNIDNKIKGQNIELISELEARLQD